jgi:hypothetical protein
LTRRHSTKSFVPHGTRGFHRSVIPALKRWAIAAMSMLDFYTNLAGKNLPKKRKCTFQQAKDQLREVFGRN